MAMCLRVFWLIALVVFLGVICARPADSQTFVYEGCSQEQYSSGSNYENNLNSLLGTLLRQASSTDYYNVTAGSGSDAVYGLYDCRGDLGSDDCANCIKNAMSQISTVCLQTRGARIQLDGCFMHYDRINFFGQADTSFIYKTCSSTMGSDTNFYTHLSTVLSNLMTASASGDNNGFRLTTAGDSTTGFVHGLAQCEGDLSGSDCNNCMNVAVQRLKDACGNAVSGQVYLGKCYVRYAQDMFYRDSSGNGNDHSSSDNGDDAGKTVAIIIGLLAGVALIVVFLSFLRQVFKQDHKG